MKAAWWKMICIVLLLYTVIAGFLMEVPRLAILNESIRNLYFHVPMWFGMLLILGISVFYSIKYLQKPSIESDDMAVYAAHTGILFGMLGLATGMAWARFTWGAWWVNDPKLNGAAIAMLIYMAYLVLRGSLEDEQQRARISAIYNIFAFATLVPLLFILPRLTDSLHPGNGGNPGFSSYDLDSRMRMVFYPAVIGWGLLSVWITQLSVRLKKLQRRSEETLHRQVQA
ncbi:cytochrome c biogenesis protein CcsA [Rhodocytophaga rosea]|uniref:Heme exporter protein C n=1 Tax=Rhodocytophaga rosea TaxID=2704465 RepID=A0A6C0GKU2_9BACT|nr:cytochrome c biogenesis protein [Rhodocytophaga rosea]QHT68625.1 cytochrome c biogenesis protein CcsA [Rhodocytophaga rosea]